MISKPSPLSLSAASVASMSVSAATPSGQQQRAELVAAHPVRAPEGRRGGRQLRTEAPEQHVAGGMAEAVVVELEAVEVVENQQAGALRRGALEGAREVVDQHAPVPQPGERVGDRERVALPLAADALAEGEADAHRRGEERREREHSRRRVDVRVAVVDEQQQPPPRSRRGSGAASARQPSSRALRAGGGGDSVAASMSSEAIGQSVSSQLVFDVGAGGDLEQVDGVGGDLHDQAQRQQAPHATRAPAGEADGGDHEQEQQQVAHRVGEVGGDDRQAAARRREDGSSTQARRRPRTGRAPRSARRATSSPGHAWRARAISSPIPAYSSG